MHVQDKRPTFGIVHITLFWIQFPGAYGVPKPWYFPLTRSYWCSSRNRVHRSVGAHGSHDGQVYSVLGEQVSRFLDKHTLVIAYLKCGIASVLSFWCFRESLVTFFALNVFSLC